MTPAPEKIQEVFQKIAALDPQERTKALDRACAGQPELRKRVQELLDAHDEPDSLLDNCGPEFEATQNSDPGDPERTVDSPGAGVDAGLVIADHYKLREKIGQGGMGEVWVARQSEPVKRSVALKLIKTGMDSRAVVNRFEQERQALALMDHPNIARVLDAGLTPTGQPFFVMELVNGLSLDKFCDQAKLSLTQRLELFVPICQAVQHAHQKGIVHRDLKPANILVTMIDGRPVPKVIDFGVAKAFGGDLVEETMTQFGAVIGTLEYMSPEQASFSNDDIDTRADIYSLGVILYELLTGLRPIDTARLKQAALTEMVRIIQEEEPSKPSTRLSTSESLPSMAALRQTDPRKLMSLLKDELDWVVMKCLEKERDRRYETANALARDIERHLNDEPVEARAPSARYRLLKFARRNRVAILTISLVAASLILGFGGSLWQAVRATRAESIANDLYEQEQDARQEAQNAQAAEEAQRLLATEARRLAARREYDANILLVQKYWEQSHLESFHELHESLKPQADEEDFRGFEWYFWKNVAKRGFVELGRHTGQVASTAYSPDGKLVASGAGNGRSPGEVSIWDTATRQLVRKLPSHEYRVHDVAFSPDGRFLATGCGEHSQGGQAKVWDLETGKEIFHRDFKNTVKSVAFSPNPRETKLLAGSSVLIGNWGELKVWDWQTGEELFSEQHENKGYRGAIFAPDGNSIVAGSRENGVPGCHIEIWSLATKDVKVLPVHAEFVFAISIRPKNDADKLDYRIAAAVGSWSGPPGVVQMWDENGVQSPIQLVGHSSRVWDVRFSHDGRRIATASFDNSIKIWDAETGMVLNTLRGHKSHALSVYFSPEDTHLVSGSGDETIRIWDAKRGQGALAIEKQSHEIHGVAFSHDGSRIASAGHDGFAKIWDAQTGLQIMGFDHGKGSMDRTNDVYCVAFSPDDKWLATASGVATSFGFGDEPLVPGDVKIWDLATQQLVHHFKGHTSKACTVAFSPDGKRLASASGGWGEGGEIKIWDIKTGKELDLGLKGAQGVTWALGFSPDGKHLAWSRFDYPPDATDRPSADKAHEEGRTKSVVVYWNLEEQVAEFEFRGHQDGVIDLAFDSVGRRFATASADNTIKLWDLKTGRELQTLKGHSDRVHTVDFSPDGRQLVSASPDRTARLWDLESGRDVLIFREHSHFVWSAAFSPDGEHIASASGDGTIKIWDGTKTLRSPIEARRQR